MIRSRRVVACGLRRERADEHGAWSTTFTAPSAEGTYEVVAVGAISELSETQTVTDAGAPSDEVEAWRMRGIDVVTADVETTERVPARPRDLRRRPPAEAAQAEESA